MKPKRALIFCVEKGILENQAILLSNSINAFTQSSEYDVFAFAPRTTHQPAEKTKKALQDNGVEVVTKPLNSRFSDYPIANKLLACNYFEQQSTDYSTILFVDTDSVFLNGFGAPLLQSEPSIFVRPVDNKGPGSEGKADANDGFWNDIYRLFNLKAPAPSVLTTVRPALIRNYFNAGLVGATAMPGFFQQWYQDFLRILESDLRPFGYQSRDGNDFRCLDQVALAVTVTRHQKYLNTLPETYNYPAPFRPIMKDRSKHPGLEELVHVHYHKWFQHPGFLSHAFSEDQNSRQYHWLNDNLPIEPEIEDGFKC